MKSLFINLLKAVWFFVLLVLILMGFSIIINCIIVAVIALFNITFLMHYITIINSVKFILILTAIFFVILLITSAISIRRNNKRIKKDLDKTREETIKRSKNEL